ncbi:MAG: type III-B CRISPR-associated protein Cas10/Cmr2 [Bacillota bacterium]|nr:type III-B CRISPR-associated protein Cas10/Cmr2 [Bacillota bacterium]
MLDAVLIFAFSPIQPFIAEARRTTDLFVASKILVQLAHKAGKAIGNHGTLVYPAALEGDVPNKIVALVPWEKVKVAAEEGKGSLLREWERIANTAKHALEKMGPPPDEVWYEIWERQTSRLWEVYWSAANLTGRSYAGAYKEADRVLAGVKRTRAFEAAEECGLKDSLSGRREALHTGRLNAKEYWTEVGKHTGAAKLRLEGRGERLDSIGATKRFCELAQAARGFPSTSTIASTDFLSKARPFLADYRQAIEKLLGNHLYLVPQDSDWPYDGDLLFIETLSQGRLQDSYGVKVQLSQELIQEARKKLREIYKKAESKPSPYYGLIVLDGDNIGKKIDECLKENNPEEAHRNFSNRLGEFSSQVRIIVEEKHHSHVVYNSGDDVVALAPLSQALPLAQILSEKFKEVTGGTASAGIAIAHHLYPLGTVTQAARDAEQAAKQIKEKASICVKVLKRSGVITEMRSPWENFNQLFFRIIGLFREEGSWKPLLAGKFPYDVAQAAHVFPEADEKFWAELKRLIKRHRNSQHPEAPDPKEWAENLQTWAAKLPLKSGELGNWLVLARFIAQGGIE